MNSIPSSTEIAAWPHFGVMGGGAVGCFYGGLLARAGAPVTIVGRTAHVAAMQARGLRITSRAFDVSVPVQASTELAALATCDIVLFATKGRDTDSVAIELAPHLDPAAVVLAFQNGVDGVDRLAARLSQQVYPAVIYVSCQMIGPGHVQHNGRGDILIGERFLARPDRAMRRTRLEEIAACLRRAVIKTTVADDVRAAMWTKLAMNCAYNALSALGRARYQRIATTDASRLLMRQVTDELVTVAIADGVDLDREGVVQQVMNLANGMPEAISSTGQDIAAGRLTEIDDLNGFVARRGRDLGIDTPVNTTLQLLIRLLEQAPIDAAFFPEIPVPEIPVPG
jgi:2-dehydropantoate 2-reductase